MNSKYLLREAAPEDAELIAQHRAQMFVDMEVLSEKQSAALMTATVPWIQRLLINREYRGWFFEQEGEVVSGGGLHLSEVGPVPKCLRIGQRGHIANVYTVPSHRRRGLARRLLQTIMIWSEQNGIDQLTLDASTDGRQLYESLGFTNTTIMHKTPLG